MTVLVEYSEFEPSSQFDNESEVAAFLKHLHESSERPVAAQITIDSGEYLQVVVGTNVSGLIYFPNSYADKATGSFISVNSESAEEVMDYWFCGHHSQLPPENTVSTKLALQAATEFCTSGGKPDIIKWTPE